MFTYTTNKTGISNSQNVHDKKRASQGRMSTEQHSSLVPGSVHCTARISNITRKLTHSTILLLSIKWIYYKNSKSALYKENPSI